MSIKAFKAFLQEGDDPKLQAVDTDKVAKNLSSILKSLKVKFSSIDGKYQPVFGGAELQFHVKGAAVSGEKLNKFVFVVWSNGNITSDASGAGIKHLVTLKKVGVIKTLSKLEGKSGIFHDIVAFTVDEIKETLSMSDRSRTGLSGFGNSESRKLNLNKKKEDK